MRFTLLRAFVVAALLANIFYAAWSRGAFGFIGWAPATQRDPARLEQQVRPDALRVLSPAATAAATAPAAATAAAVVGPPPPTLLPLAEAASAPTSSPSAPATAGASSGAAACLDVGPLDGSAAIDSVEQALVAVLPARPWIRVQRPAGAQFAVFVGPIMSRDAARQRREELIKLRLSFETIELPDGKSSARIGGYSLGLHDSEAAAAAALDALRERGLRNARVVPTGEAGGQARTWLRMERLSAAQADAVRALAATQPGGVKAGECVLGSVMSVRAPR